MAISESTWRYIKNTVDYGEIPPFHLIKYIVIVLKNGNKIRINSEVEFKKMIAEFNKQNLIQKADVYWNDEVIKKQIVPYVDDVLNQVFVD